MRVLVTGANRGIGAAIASHLVAEGHTVWGTHRGAPVPEGVHGVECDVTDDASVDRAFTHVEKEDGPVEAVIANAGITDDTLIMRMTSEQFIGVVDTNLTGVFRVVKRATRNMLKNKAGRIVIIGSASGMSGMPGQVNYTAAKAGVIGIARSLARELGSRGITANVVAPGFTETDNGRGRQRQGRRDSPVTYPSRPLREAGGDRSYRGIPAESWCWVHHRHCDQCRRWNRNGSLKSALKCANSTSPLEKMVPGNQSTARDHFCRYLGVLSRSAADVHGEIDLFG